MLLASFKVCSEKAFYLNSWHNRHLQHRTALLTPPKGSNECQMLLIMVINCYKFSYSVVINMVTNSVTKYSLVEEKKWQNVWNKRSLNETSCNTLYW